MKKAILVHFITLYTFTLAAQCKVETEFYPLESRQAKKSNVMLNGKLLYKGKMYGTPDFIPDKEHTKYIQVWAEHNTALFECNGNKVADFGEKYVFSGYFQQYGCYEVHDKKNNSYYFADSLLNEFPDTRVDEVMYPERIGSSWDKLLQPVYHYISLVKKNGLVGVFDYELKKMILPARYKSISNEFVNQNVFYVTDESGKNYFIDAVTGNKFGPDHVQQINTSARYRFSDCVILNTGDLVGLINLRNRTFAPIKYDQLSGAFNGKVTMARLKGSTKFCFLSEDGKEITDHIFDAGFWHLENEKIMFTQNGKKGLLHNISGKILLPAKYREIIPLVDVYGVQSVTNNKWAIINTNGVELSAYVYDELKLDILTIVAKNGDKLDAYDYKGNAYKGDYSAQKVKDLWQGYEFAVSGYNGMYTAFYDDWTALRDNKGVAEFEKRRRFEKFLSEHKPSLLSKANDIRKIINQLLNDFPKYLKENDITRLNKNLGVIESQIRSIEPVTVKNLHDNYEAKKQ
jgi:hypothetical protein